MLRPPLCILLALTFGCGSALAGAEWRDLKSQYYECTVIGGLGAANGDLNPNEWNNADGQPATTAELSEPHSAMADIWGRIYVADKNAHAVRRIDTDGTIHTVAGMNLNELPPGTLTNAGYTGDGPARQRLLNGPQHAYVLPDGTFYILDSENMMIRRVDPDGTMTTVVTDDTVLNRGLWVSRDRQLIYYCSNAKLKRWTASMGNTEGVTVAAGFKQAANIDLDPAGNIYVTDRDDSLVYRVPPGYGGANITSALVVAGTGTDKNSGKGSNGEKATDVGLLEVRGIAFHPLGGYFLATHAGGDIWYIDTSGDAWLFVQGNSNNEHDPDPAPVPNDDSIMSEPRSVTVSLNGDVIIACNDAGHIRIVRSIAPRPAPPAWKDLTLLPANAGLHLRWQSNPGEWYLVESAPSLTTDPWSALRTLPSAGATTAFTAPVTGSVPRFFRVRSLRAWPN